MGFLKCFCWFLIIGVISFIAGRIMPKHWISFDKFPFAPFDFEMEGKIYKKIGIAKWQSKVPDMSRVFKKIMPPKRIENRPEIKELVLMIEETCVAEIVHILIIFCGAGYLMLWEGFGGILCFLLNVFANLVFVVIQRYNRPRLMKILKRKGYEPKKESAKFACSDTQLQHRRRT
ncbi:MAG: glycosyl-4,4'-diaponeurosporenoate acyltransferase [Oscillospiraceae bacterium]|nr:glycosyl-4,4'-diaponeurosporenoate acyltransferase [Oscillospiraceae bacterium]